MYLSFGGKYIFLFQERGSNYEKNENMAKQIY